MIQKSYDISNYGKLYLVPTPIGNMEDITLRALEILKMVDIIYAEDTRETLSLLKYYKIKKQIQSCHKYSEMKNKDKIIQILKSGKNIAYVTDRGTPLISDPGNVIVSNCIENNIDVISLPGPNALLPAINMSGLSNEKFLFYGFLNSKKSIAKKELEKIKDIEYSIIFYESPFRIIETLNNIKDIFGDRMVAIVREISKIHEEVIRDTISNILNNYDKFKGEIVIVVEGLKKTNDENIDYLTEIKELLKKDYTKKDACKIVAERHNISKNSIYNKYKEI